MTPTTSPSPESLLADERRENRIVAFVMGATVAVASVVLLYVQ